MIEVIAREPSSSPNLEELARQAAGKALTHEGQPDSLDMTIVLSDDAELRTLNLQFMGIDAPTDVLSFPADEVDPESGERYLGDIILSVERAKEQSGQGNHPIEAEIQLLIVHGVLHLLGYDHANPEGKARMWSVQAEILKELGSPLQFPAE
jgi:probable rRNA maturation factor